MHVALVALPWAMRDRPCFSIAALAAFVQRAHPSWTVKCSYDYVRFARELGDIVYDRIADQCYALGEVLNIAVLYPERRAAAIEQFNAKIQGFDAPESPDQRLPRDPTELTPLLEQCLARYDAYLDVLADGLVEQRVVGLTTSFGQLFSNLALAEKIKKRAPEVLIVLGGSTISSAVGPSILNEYPCVDYVIQGEGELPFLGLLEAVERGDPQAARALSSVLCRETADAHPKGTELTELGSLDQLPTPHFDEYAALAREFDVDWQIPIEGSRGCWWDRVKKTGDVKQTCYFCNLNIQWKGYREKSAARIADEMKLQSDRYGKTGFYFLDNIIRHKGIDELTQKIRANGQDYKIFYEMRANVSPHEMLLLAEAGVNQVQIGIEGLSTALLKRMGKGTTALKNLEAMRSVFELGIVNAGNLIVDFPGSTQEEADETFRITTEYALAYEPLRVSNFSLGIDNTVHALRDQFPIQNVRNGDSYMRALPEDVGKRLQLFDLSFDFGPDKADWSKIRRFCGNWMAIAGHLTGERFLFYDVGPDSIRIKDFRGVLKNFFADLDLDLGFLRSLPRARVFELRGRDRDLFLYCMQIKSIEQIEQRFVTSESERLEMLSTLDSWCESRLMFREGNRVLALPVAKTRELAAARIFHEAAESQAKKPVERKRLELLG